MTSFDDVDAAVGEALERRRERVLVAVGTHAEAELDGDVLVDADDRADRVVDHARADDA